MTRRGSLAYYLAAWAVGAFSISAGLWIRYIVANGWAWAERSHDLGLFRLYVDALILGPIVTLLIAFLLRRSMSTLKCLNAPAWILAGAILAPAITFIFGWADDNFFRAIPRPQNYLNSNLFVAKLLLLGGPSAVMNEGWWLTIPAGAATACVLYRIERAFAPQNANAKISTNV